jgi:threonine dehydrogenase-like Zn-dependent dehydrogenase
MKESVVMSHQIKAIVFPEPGKVDVRDFVLPPPGDEDILVKSLYTMVSPGTELRGWSGKADFPMIPGYATIGEVIGVGAKVKGYRVGDLVSGRSCKRFFNDGQFNCGGHQSGHLFPTAGEDRAVLLPAGANPKDYVIAEIAAISRRGVAAARVQPGETALVIGQGLIGSLSAAWLQAAGCHVVVTDLEDGRLQRAMARGAFAAVNGKEPDARERLLAHVNGGADIVVESSGSSAGVKLAYSLVGAKPRSYPYVEGASYRGESMAATAGQWPRLIMQASYTEEVAIHPHGFYPGEGIVILTPADRSLEDRQETVKALAAGRIKAADFVDRILTHREAPDAYKTLRDDKNRYFSVVFDWRNE